MMSLLHKKYVSAAGILLVLAGILFFAIKGSTGAMPSV
jgi:hypothetical protein